MDRPGLQQSSVMGLLVCVCAYVIFVWLPAVSETQLVGFDGEYLDGSFTVTRVFPGSPAERADLRIQDRIVGLQGRSVEQWHRDFESDLAAYIAGSNNWRHDSVTLEIVRDGEVHPATLSPRSLNFFEALYFFGVRTAIVVITLGLVVILLMSRPRDACAFPIALVFCTLSLWLVTDSTYTPFFFSPLLVDGSFPEFLIRQLLAIISLQATLSLGLHIALVFPVRRPVLDKHPWLLVLIYMLPMGVLAVVLLATGGNLTERLNAVLYIRLWLDTSILVLFVLLVLDSYRKLQSATQREQTRWVMIAQSIAVLCMVGIWNVPQMVLGHPLVPDFDWVLVPILLIPLSFTFAIANHELLGVRGIIGRRIRVLETLVAREKSAAGRKDARIRDLAHELGQLRSELAEYVAREGKPANSPSDAAEPDGLKRLESRHPVLAHVRETRLIGQSPKWEPVFEEMVLAARGEMPVLVVGESGTGKTDVAWAIWQLSERAAQPYKEISCAQFEHADPAFSLGRLFGIGTGHGLPNVHKDGQRGMLEDCDGGTLFLDDFDRLPLNIQDLFLYPFEGKAFEPGIGAGLSRSVSIKFILAVNQETDALIGSGLVRPDVLARVGARVNVPSLRDRAEDIPLLVEHFVATTSADLQHDISSVSPKAMSLMSSYAYARGNVRELKSEIAQAIGRSMLEDSHELRAGHLSPMLRGLDEVARVGADSAVSVDTGDRSDGSADVQRAPWESMELDVLRKHAFNLQAAETELGLSHKSRTLSNHLRGMCILAVTQSDWNVERAAGALSGSHSPRTTSKLEGKIRRFLENIDEKVASGEESKLFNNLPIAYHDALMEAIAHVRTQSP
jgi:DNA-binding NtrC family response regulator